MPLGPSARSLEIGFDWEPRPNGPTSRGRPVQLTTVTTDTTSVVRGRTTTDVLLGATLSLREESARDLADRGRLTSTIWLRRKVRKDLGGREDGDVFRILFF